MAQEVNLFTTTQGEKKMGNRGRSEEIDRDGDINNGGQKEKWR